MVFFVVVTGVFGQDKPQLERELNWFFKKMFEDQIFRQSVFGINPDDLSETLSFLEGGQSVNPLSKWLVLLDSENWPESRSFGILLDSRDEKCIEKFVVDNENIEETTTKSHSRFAVREDLSNRISKR